MQIAHSIAARLGVTFFPPVPNYTRKVNYQMARRSLTSVSIDCRANIAARNPSGRIAARKT